MLSVRDGSQTGKMGGQTGCKPSELEAENDATSGQPLGWMVPGSNGQVENKPKYQAPFPNYPPHFPK